MLTSICIYKDMYMNLDLILFQLSIDHNRSLFRDNFVNGVSNTVLIYYNNAIYYN